MPTSGRVSRARNVNGEKTPELEQTTYSSRQSKKTAKYQNESDTVKDRVLNDLGTGRKKRPSPKPVTINDKDVNDTTTELLEDKENIVRINHGNTNQLTRFVQSQHNLCIPSQENENDFIKILPKVVRRKRRRKICAVYKTKPKPAYHPSLPTSSPRISSVHENQEKPSLLLTFDQLLQRKMRKNIDVFNFSNFLLSTPLQIRVSCLADTYNDQPTETVYTTAPYLLFEKSIGSSFSTIEDCLERNNNDLLTTETSSHYEQPNE